MDIITFFGEEKSCVHERNRIMEWYGDEYLPLPSQMCIEYCGGSDYAGENLPLFEDLLRETSLRKLNGNTQVTSSILHIRDVQLLRILSDVYDYDVYVKYIGSPIYNQRYNVLLMKLLKEPFTHVRIHR